MSAYSNLACLDCGLLVGGHGYLKHRMDLHNHQDINLCIWCKSYIWPVNRKDYVHLLACFKTKVRKIITTRPIIRLTDDVLREIKLDEIIEGAIWSRRRELMIGCLE